MIITIVGAGNAGSANAFVAAANGHEVRVLKTSHEKKNDEHFETMQRNGGLWGIDNTRSAKYSEFAHEGEKSFQKLAMITRDPAEAIEGADVIMVFVLVEFQEGLAKRVGRYFTENQLVVLVPGDFPLDEARVFFGSPELPERVRRPQIDLEVARARDAGVTPPSRDHVTAVVDAATFHAATEYELRQRAVDLVERYSPQERDLISGWRVPRVQVP